MMNFNLKDDSYCVVKVKLLEQYISILKYLFSMEKINLFEKLFNNESFH